MKAEQTRPAASSATHRRRANSAWHDAMRQGQMTLFADDAMGAISVMAIADDAQASVDVAISVNPAILAGARPDTRDSLEFARFMRSAGVPLDEVSATLESVGAEAAPVMERLHKVEAIVGTDDYASRNLLSNDDEIDESDGHEAGRDDSDLETDPPAAPARRKDKALAANAPVGDVPASALGALLAKIRGSRFQPLTPEDETALGLRVRAGDRAARNELIEHNMRFLVMQARNFMYTGRQLDQLVSAGVFGLIAAAEKFDPARGRFTTVATWWIRQSIQRWLLTDNLMKSPAYMQPKENKLRKAAGQATSSEERTRLTAEADSLAREIKGRRAAHVSIDADDDEDGEGLHNMFASEAEGPDEIMDKRRLITQLVKAAESVDDPRAGNIFLLRIGLHEDHMGTPQTLAEIGAVHNLSRERVRQIYSDAAAKVASAVEVWARGAENLPPGFRKGLMSPGRA